MKWNINDAERRLELIDEHGDIKVIAKFINKEDISVISDTSISFKSTSLPSCHIRCSIISFSSSLVLGK